MLLFFYIVKQNKVKLVTVLFDNNLEKQHPTGIFKSCHLYLTFYFKLNATICVLGNIILLCCPLVGMRGQCPLKKVRLIVLLYLLFYFYIVNILLQSIYLPM